MQTTVYTIPVLRKHRSFEGNFWYFKVIKSSKELRPAEFYYKSLDKADELIRTMKRNEIYDKRIKQEKIIRESALNLDLLSE